MVTNEEYLERHNVPFFTVSVGICSSVTSSQSQPETSKIAPAGCKSEGEEFRLLVPSTAEVTATFHRPWNEGGEEYQHHSFDTILL